MYLFYDQLMYFDYYFSKTDRKNSKTIFLLFDLLWFLFLIEKKIFFLIEMWN